MINQVLTIDLEPNGRAPRVLVHASQYDDGREIRVNLTMEGEPYELPEGSTVSLSTRKPSGSITYSAVAATAGESHVVFALTEQMTAEYGASLCELSIVGDGQDPIGTANWLMLVEMSPLSVGGPTDSWVPDIDRAIEQAQEYAEEAGEKVLDAEAWAVGQRAGEDVPSTDPTYENNAKYYAGAAEASVTDAAGYAADAAAQATAAEGYAGSAAGSADNAAASAGAAAGSAIEASGYATAASGYADSAYQYAGAAEAQAENAAASAGDAADSASASASSAADALGHARDAESAAGVAAGASEAAGASATAASGYASTAQGHAASAAGSASAAAGSASQASTYAGNASASATQASGYADNASASATQASGYADAAAASAADVAAEAAQIEINKEDIADLKSAFSEFPSGSYPDMTVGGVMSVEDAFIYQVPYIFDVAGGGHKIGNREIDQLVGGTVAFNQLLVSNRNEGTAYSTTKYSITDGVLHIYGTWGGNNGSQFAINNGNDVPIPDGHKVLLCGGDSHVRMRLDREVSSTVAASKVSAVNGSNWTSKIDVAVYYDNGTDLGALNLYYKLMVIDLTQMFGSTIADYVYALETAHAGDGVAWFRRLFPNDYYAYDVGSLKSVEGVSAHTMRGFNQWDEQWEVGGLSNGSNASNSDRIRAKNMNPILPGTVYYLYRANNTGNFWISYYDADKNYIAGGNPAGTGTLSDNATFTTPSNARYFRFQLTSTTAYHAGDFCINISGDRNGTYEPYDGHTYPLDSSLTLQGIFKIDSANRLYADGDIYPSDGQVKRRYALIDLGDYNWTYDSSHGAFYGASSSRKKWGFQNLICSKYATRRANTGDNWNLDDKSIGGGNNSSYIYIKDTAYTDSATLKASLSGAYCVYELATPTTEQADPFTNPQIVDNLGTEEYVTTGIVPVGHSTIYPTDIVAKVDGLPSDFSTLIAPTETAYKATRAYSVNQFLIVSNQLYKVTASIASGATITPGTNVTAVTVADILTQLLNA